MKKLLAVLLCLGLAGCATPAGYQSLGYSISIDGLNNGQDTDNKKVFIAPPAGINDPESDLQFVEFSNYIKKGLTQNGAVIVNKVEDADILVTLRYGISDPKEHTYNYSVPIFGQTGVASSTTNATGQFFKTGPFISGGYSGTTTYTPSYGVIGSSTQQETIVSFLRYFVLEAYDLITYRETKKIVQLWKISVSSVGGSGDLRRIFPVLVAGSAPYFGRDTGHKIELEIGDDDASIVAIKESIKYIVTEAQVERVGLNWSDVSGKLTQNGWADIVNPKEVRLKVNFSMEKDKISKVFGDEFSKIWPILEQSENIS